MLSPETFPASLRIRLFDQSEDLSRVIAFLCDRLTGAGIGSSIGRHTEPAETPFYYNTTTGTITDAPGYDTTTGSVTDGGAYMRNV